MALTVVVNRDHRYECHLFWTGSTADGYASYNRDHQVKVPPAGDEISLSSDATFGGKAELANPEQLLLAAASSCQLLSFLAVAARAGVDVVGYEDDAEALMPEDSRPQRITRIILRPHVTVAAGTVGSQVLELLELGHRECYVANTLNAEVVIEPTVAFAIAKN